MGFATFEIQRQKQREAELKAKKAREVKEVKPVEPVEKEVEEDIELETTEKTEIDLENMEWNDLRALAKEHGVDGRLKKVEMIEELEGIFKQGVL